MKVFSFDSPSCLAVLKLRISSGGRNGRLQDSKSRRCGVKREATKLPDARDEILYSLLIYAYPCRGTFIVLLRQPLLIHLIVKSGPISTKVVGVSGVSHQLFLIS